MSKLSVQTRGNSTPQGKPRVYFCCHPQDFSICFSLLCQDLLTLENCAVYYETDWSSPADPALLEDMRLFVVPLTTNFLTKPCRAREVEYGFALEHHIPVLPIAMEPGLEGLFQEVMDQVHPGCGQVQFLDRTARNQGGIPYQEKLKRRLASILAGDQLTQAVRDAFDAYLFLSYRKKDRTQARHLMELIHQIPFCRDVAI